MLHEIFHVSDFGIFGIQTLFSYELTISILCQTSPSCILSLFLFLQGLPKVLHVKPEEEMVIENGTAPVFHVEVQDMSGNITTDKNLTVTCKVCHLSQTNLTCNMCTNSSCKVYYIKINAWIN